MVMMMVVLIMVTTGDAGGGENGDGYNKPYQINHFRQTSYQTKFH